LATIVIKILHDINDLQLNQAAVHPDNQVAKTAALDRPSIKPNRSLATSFLRERSRRFAAQRQQPSWCKHRALLKEPRGVGPKAPPKKKNSLETEISKLLI
jgi:hypothetical protein